MNLRYELTTTPHANGDILQTLEMVSRDMRETIMRSVVHTSEAQIREALIKLGWTPPPTVDHHPV